MKISLCMITRNEEGFIAKCLESIKNEVDEIIIVDTGSTDHTCQLALNYGAKIYHVPWENNFSKARNFGLNRAKGNWILYLDADESLEQGKPLKQLVEAADSDVDGFLFNIINYFDEQKTETEHSVSLRLFRNKQEMRFSGAIHEQLPTRGKSVVLTDLNIYHFGYIPSISKIKGKSKRNIKILEQELKDNPNDGFVYYNLGTEYLRLNQYEQAIHFYEEALKLIDGENGFESRLYKMLAICYLAKKKWHDSIATLNNGLAKFRDYPDLYYIRGVSYSEIKKNSDALIDFITCLTLNESTYKSNQMYVIENGVTSYKAYYSLGQIYEKLQKKEEALTAYAKSIETNLHFSAATKRVGELFLNNPEGLEQFYEKRLFPKVKGKQNSNFVHGICYFRLNNFNQAIKYLSQIKNDEKDYSAAIPYLVSSIWLSGNISKAKRLIAKSSSLAELYQRMIGIFWANGEKNLKIGITKYPDSAILQKKYQLIQRVKHDAKFNTTP